MEVKLKQVNVSEFLAMYNSKSTRTNYRMGLKQFFRLMYPHARQSIDELSERYLAEDRDYRDDMLKLKASLEGKAPKTMKSRFNAVRVFFDYNGITLPKSLFRRMNGKATGAITYEAVPTNEELKRICEYMPIQGKALTLVLASSGMRVGEAVTLELDDIDFNFRYKEVALCKIRIKGENTKTGKARITFISPEAKDAVDEWLNYQAQYKEQAEGRKLSYEARFHKEDEGWTGDEEKENNRAKVEGLLFPFSTSNYGFMWRNALAKAKLSKIDKKTNRLEMRPHNLRKFFRLRVGRHGRDEAEALMGHQEGLNRVYARFEGKSGEQRLAEIYVKAIGELSIFEYAVKENTVQFEILQENRKLEQSVRQLREKNDVLWDKVEELKNDFVRMFDLIQKEEDFSEVLRKYVKW
jgi:integrase